jgi:hypothetical protein
MAKRKSKHPMQPVEKNSDGVIRFKPNKIAQFLLGWSSDHGMSLNDLARLPFDDEEREHFAQLIGYSVSGFGELSYVSKQAIAEADAKADEILKRKKRQ